MLLQFIVQQLSQKKTLGIFVQILSENVLKFNQRPTHPHARLLSTREYVLNG